MVKSLSSISYNLSVLDKLNHKVNTALGTQEALEYGSDNSVLYSKILGIRADINSYTSISQHISLSKAFNSTSDDTMAEVKKTTESIIGELIKANTGTMGQNQREIIATQLEDFRNSLLTLSNTQVDSQYLFSGVNTDVMPFSKDPTTGVISYQSDNSTKKVNVEDGTYSPQGINGIEAFYYVDAEAGSGDSFTFTSNNIILDKDGNEWELMDADTDGTFDSLYINGDTSTTPIAVTDNGDGTFSASNTSVAELEVHRSVFDDLNNVINALRLKDNDGNDITEADQETVITDILDRMKKAFESQNIAHSLVGTRTSTIESYGSVVSSKLTNLKVLEKEYGSADLTSLGIQAKALEITYTALYSTISRINQLSLVNYMR